MFYDLGCKGYERWASALSRELLASHNLNRTLKLKNAKTTIYMYFNNEDLVFTIQNLYVCVFNPDSSSPCEEVATPT